MLSWLKVVAELLQCEKAVLNMCFGYISNIFFPASSGGSDITAVLPGVNQSFPSDVESEANSYFQKIYNQPPNLTMTIDEVLEMLKKFKDSSSKKEKVSVESREFSPGIPVYSNREC